MPALTTTQRAAKKAATKASAKKPSNEPSWKQRISTRKLEPYQPSARDLEIYEAHARWETERSIADRFHLSPASVHEICVKVGQYKARNAIDEIDAIRAQVTATYSHIVNEALDAWKWMRENTLKPEFVVDQETGATVEVRMPGGSPGDGYLKTAITALNEVRKVWHADVQPPKREAERKNDGLDGERVAGRSQTQILETIITKLQQRLEPGVN